MSSGSLTPPSQASASPRVRLARGALEAALAVPGVLAAEAGTPPVRVTADPEAGLLRGVSVIAQTGGVYAVDLRLAAGLVPLLPLGEEVRRRVRERARRDGVAEQLGDVNVEFARMLAPGEGAG